jgi:hypothetical protein
MSPLHCFFMGIFLSSSFLGLCVLVLILKKNFVLVLIAEQYCMIATVLIKYFNVQFLRPKAIVCVFFVLKYRNWCKHLFYFWCKASSVVKMMY